MDCHQAFLGLYKGWKKYSGLVRMPLWYCMPIAEAWCIRWETFLQILWWLFLSDHHHSIWWTHESSFAFWQVWISWSFVFLPEETFQKPERWYRNPLRGSWMLFGLFRRKPLCNDWKGWECWQMNFERPHQIWNIKLIIT